MNLTRPILELNNVTKLYGSARGVSNISFLVHPGTVFGFLGPNGAGKTTTISMLVDLLRPTSGSIRVFGLDSVRDSVEIRRRVGFLAGDMALDRSLTGWQQLEYLAYIHGVFDKAYVQELAARLECKLDKKFKTLSRGNKQKVGLIAALMHKPELLILDEPTSGLDPLMQAEFNKIMLEHKEMGKTVFVSSHVLSEVQEICDHVAFIRDGEIIKSTTVSELAHGLPKRFTLVGLPTSLAANIKKLSGVTNITASGDMLSGSFQGDINQLIRLVARHKVTGFEILGTDLESIFLQYYEADNV